ncbi:unnamed protein product [Rotaria magnacalcarata]
MFYSVLLLLVLSFLSRVNNRHADAYDVFIRDQYANNRFHNSSIEDGEVQQSYHRIRRSAVHIPVNAKLVQKGVTVAGGHGEGSATNQLYWPRGFCVDDDQTLAIADTWNQRITQWTKDGTTNGQVVAGGKGRGNGLNQLNIPTDVLIDKKTDNLIICDQGNRRVVRWSRRTGTTEGKILIDSIDCDGLAMDEQRYLYVSDYVQHEVRRYQLGEKNYTLVAGGNGLGEGLNQLY